MVHFYRAGDDWPCPSCDRNIVLIESDYHEYEQLAFLQHAGDHSFGQLIYRVQLIACRRCGYVTAAAGLYRPSLGGDRRAMRRSDRNDRFVMNGTYAETQIYPPAKARTYNPGIVPPKIIRDYTEAAAVADLSPRASMVLSRRCLESIVRGFFEGTGGSLHAALHSVKVKIDRIDAKLFDALMALKGLGNIGAHPGDDVDFDIELSPSEAQQAVKMLELLLDATYIEKAHRAQAFQEIVDAHDSKKRA